MEEQVPPVWQEWFDEALSLLKRLKSLACSFEGVGWEFPEPFPYDFSKDLEVDIRRESEVHAACEERRREIEIELSQKKEDDSSELSGFRERWEAEYEQEWLQKELNELSAGRSRECGYIEPGIAFCNRYHSHNTISVMLPDDVDPDLTPVCKAFADIIVHFRQLEEPEPALCDSFQKVPVATIRKFFLSFCVEMWGEDWTDQESADKVAQEFFEICADRMPVSAEQAVWIVDKFFRLYGIYEGSFAGLLYDALDFDPTSMTDVPIHRAWEEFVEGWERQLSIDYLELREWPIALDIMRWYLSNDKWAQARAVEEYLLSITFLQGQDEDVARDAISLLREADTELALRGRPLGLPLELIKKMRRDAEKNYVDRLVERCGRIWDELTSPAQYALTEAERTYSELAEKWHETILPGAPERQRLKFCHDIWQAINAEFRARILRPYCGMLSDPAARRESERYDVMKLLTCDMLRRWTYRSGSNLDQLTDVLNSEALRQIKDARNEYEHPALELNVDVEKIWKQLWGIGVHEPLLLKFFKALPPPPKQK